MISQQVNVHKALRTVCDQHIVSSYRKVCYLILFKACILHGVRSPHKGKIGSWGWCKIILVVTVCGYSICGLSGIKVCGVVGWGALQKEHLKRRMMVGNKSLGGTLNVLY